MSTNQFDKANRFRALHKAPGVFVIPNPWDIGSARMLAGLGFPALATSSAAAAAAVGRKDGELTRDEALAHAHLIVSATDLPVSADLERGFGEKPEAVAETIRLAADAGLVGCTIEDSTGIPERPLYDLQLAVERIAASVQAARSLPFPFMLTARAHNLLYENPSLDETIRRLQAFEKAGADVLFAPGLPDLAAVKRVCAAVSKPVNFMVGIKGKSFSVAELAEAGVKRISLATSLYRAAMTGLLEAASEVKTAGEFSFLDRSLTTPELQKLMQVQSQPCPPAKVRATGFSISDSDGRGGSMDRRRFLQTAAATTVITSLSKKLSHAAETATVPMRTLGRSGEKVSMVGLGGFHIGMQSDEQESIRIIRSALDGGINFLDNCWDYNGGQSEIRMGKALRDGYRQKAFLMTKIDGRTKQSASQQIEESLRRLQTDHIDLLQFHEVIRETDPDRIFASGGGMEAVLEAKKQGKVRYIGFTGHKSPDIHLKMLNTAFAHHFTFDAVQMPLNVMDAHFNSFEKKVLPVLVEHKIGVLGMKPIGDKLILKSKTASPIECLHYAMNLPTSVVITGCDSMDILHQALEAARTFKAMGPTEVAGLLAKTAPAAKEGEFERYKTSNDFDGTVHNPQWLG